jgi:hypothetical protein
MHLCRLVVARRLASWSDALLLFLALLCARMPDVVVDVREDMELAVLDG